MLIGELAAHSGFSRDTIRFYEKKGLINPDKKARRANNYKEYSETILKQLLIIKRFKAVGFTLNETAELLKMVEQNQASCSNVAERMESRIEVLDQKIKELTELRNFLAGQKDKRHPECVPESNENCPSLEKEIETNL